MLYFFHGTDAIRSRKKLHVLVDDELAAHPGAGVIFLAREEFLLEELSNYGAQQGLFAETQVVVFDHVLDRETKDEGLFAHLPDLAESQNLIIFLETEATPALAQGFKKAGAEVLSFAQPTSRPQFNVFQLTDAFGARDKKRAWILFRKGVFSEGGDEKFLSHLAALLHWQVKNMLFAGSAKSAEAAGMKPFVFQKSKSFLSHYSRKELLTLSAALVCLTHDARRGLTDLEAGLERLILSL